MAQKKKNKVYYPAGYDFAVVFYNNSDNVTIIDTFKVNEALNNNWTSVEKHVGRIEAVAKVDNKHTYLSRILNKTENGKQCDHINGNTSDNRLCNLRNCTQVQNLRNMKNRFEGIITETDKGYKIEFPKNNFIDLFYPTYKEAEQVLNNLLFEKYGEFSYTLSQKIASEHEINYFNDDKIECTGIFQKIRNLPKCHVLNVALNFTIMNMLNGRISDECFSEQLLKIINDYNKYEKNTGI